MTDDTDKPVIEASNTEVHQAIVEMPAIAGFWRRLAAFIVDGFLLGIMGMMAGYLLFDSLARMGGAERLIGFGIALCYAGLLNSRLAGGQTLGKHLLGIRVVGCDGHPLPLPRALIRQVVFSLPFFLNGAISSPSIILSGWGYLLSVVIFGGLFAIFYLFTFNRGTRQSLHDLAVGSYVARVSQPMGVMLTPSVWRGHLVVVSLMAILAAMAPAVGERLSRTEIFADMLPLQEALSSQPGVLTATVTVGVATRFNSGQTSYVATALRLDNPDVGDQAFARKIAARIKSAYPPAAGKEVISVRLVYGYDMVISSQWNSHSYSFNPREISE